MNEIVSQEAAHLPQVALSDAGATKALGSEQPSAGRADQSAPLAAQRALRRSSQPPLVQGSLPKIKRGPFAGLDLDGYDLIMADPPWKFENYSAKGNRKGAAHHYDCMSLEDIKRLPVAQLASDNCFLWLWATNPMLDQAFEVMRAWGFTYKSAGSWEKRTKNGKQAFGTGFYLRSSNEPFLLGTIGCPTTTNNLRSSFEGVVREHSRKPEEGFLHAERLLPGARRLELFSRQERKGWTVWGNQTNHFKETPHV